MAVEIRVPALGESIVDAVIVKWLKQPGEPVARSEPLVELETDKVNVEVPAEQAGTMGEILRAENDTVAVGELLGTILPATADVAAAAPATAPVPSSQLAEAAALSTASAAAPHRAGPAVRRLAAEKAVDLASVSGSGPGGRVVSDDVLRGTAPATAQIVPAASIVAREPARPAPGVPSAAPVASLNGREERQRMSRRRQSIATRLVEAQRTAAMLTTFNEVDMGAVMDLRKRRREAFKERHGVGLGYMSFFTKACVAALRAFPRVNAEIQGDEIVLKHYYDIGIAVGADEGLVVPVIRDADRKTFAEIEREVNDLGMRARDNKLTLTELQGGTFTITNGGIFGSLLSTPILNAPQSGILGMHKIEERPIARNGEVIIRSMMYLALSYDHRIVDGREAVQFLVKVKELLEDPENLLLEG